MSSGKWIGSAAVLLVVAAWWRATHPIGTVTTSESFDLSPFGGPTTYPVEVQRFAAAIAKQEGFYQPGSIPQRAHNPGDLKVPNWPTLPGTSISAYGDDAAGWAALYRQLYLIVRGESGRYTLDMTIGEMARVWTATQQTAWATNVADYLGVSTETPLWEVLA